MGNTHSGGVNNYAERLPLGESSEIELHKTKSRKGRQVVDTWTAEYSIGRKSCELGFTKTQHQEDEVTISIHDRASTYANDDFEFKMDMSVVERLLLGNINLDGPSSMKQLPMCKTPTPQGGVLKSSSFLYGSDTDRKALLVILRAKNNDDDKELPYMITVKHYFLAAGSSHGACVAAKIRSDSDGGGLSFQLEKPVLIPRCHLLTVFVEVTRKGWKLNPNGSDFAIELPNQNKSKVPVVLFGGRNNHANDDPSSCSITGQQNISSLVSTTGTTNGDYNGSLIFRDCQIMFGAFGNWRF